MVRKENPVYLFVGQDPFSKDARLQKLKEEFLDKDTASFNLDVLYGKELTLKEMQEKFLYLPLKTKKRMILIKDAQLLKDDTRDFILNYAKNPSSHLLLVLDIDRHDYKDQFLSGLSRLAQVFRFKETVPQDVFSLSRQIEFRKAKESLQILNKLLRNGEKPERILGGLRYSLLKGANSGFEIKRRLKLLLNCDLVIKTGRFKPAFALERFVINLCCFGRNLPR